MCPLKDGWTNKTLKIHTMEYYSALKRHLDGSFSWASILDLGLGHDLRVLGSSPSGAKLGWLPTFTHDHPDSGGGEVASAWTCPKIRL